MSVFTLGGRPVATQPDVVATCAEESKWPDLWEGMVSLDFGLLPVFGNFPSKEWSSSFADAMKQMDEMIGSIILGHRSGYSRDGQKLFFGEEG